MNTRRNLGSALDTMRRIKMRLLPRLQSDYLYMPGSPRLRVLVIGVYLAGRVNTAAQLAREFSTSKHLTLTQHWAAIGERSHDPYLSSVTSEQSYEKVPRSILLNRLLTHADCADFDYVVVCDDDIVVRKGHLDLYLGLQTQHGLSLAQPARTRNSWIDHPITCQVDRLDCRITRFVEIGPMFSIHRRLFDHLLPFDEISPMGWGLDFVWPVIVESQGLRMGIIDATPVDHSLRQPKTGYNSVEALTDMKRLWSTNAFLTPKQAQINLKEVPHQSII